MWQKQLKTTLQDVLGQLLKYGVASSGLTLQLRCYCALARDLSRVCIRTLVQLQAIGNGLFHF